MHARTNAPHAHTCTHIHTINRSRRQVPSLQPDLQGKVAGRTYGSPPRYCRRGTGPYDWDTLPSFHTGGENPAFLTYKDVDTAKTVYSLWIGGRVWLADSLYVTRNPPACRHITLCSRTLIGGASLPTACFIICNGWQGHHNGSVIVSC